MSTHKVDWYDVRVTSVVFEDGNVISCYGTFEKSQLAYWRKEDSSVNVNLDSRSFGSVLSRCLRSFSLWTIEERLSFPSPNQTKLVLHFAVHWWSLQFQCYCFLTPYISRVYNLAYVKQNRHYYAHPFVFAIFLRLSAAFCSVPAQSLFP